MKVEKVKNVAVTNEAIARFMGVDVDFSQTVYKDSKSTLRHLIDNRLKSEGLLFHESIDWQKPVADKIRLMGFRIKINMTPVDNSVYISKEGVTIASAPYWSRLEDAFYNAILSFLEYYNLTTPTNR